MLVDVQRVVVYERPSPAEHRTALSFDSRPVNTLARPSVRAVRVQAPLNERVQPMKRIVTALFVAAFAAAAYADGAATFASKCAACHGKQGEGAKMAPNPIAGMPAADVEKAITEGKGKMKPQTVDNADEVAAYVASLKK